MAKKLGFGLMRLPSLDPNDPSKIDLEETKKMVDTFLERADALIGSKLARLAEHRTDGQFSVFPEQSFQIRLSKMNVTGRCFNNKLFFHNCTPQFPAWYRREKADIAHAVLQYRYVESTHCFCCYFYYNTCKMPGQAELKDRL